MFAGLEELCFTFLDTIENLDRRFHSRNRLMPYPFQDETFEETLLRIAGKRCTWPDFFGFSPDPNLRPKRVDFQQYLPLTIYASGNSSGDYWNGWDSTSSETGRCVEPNRGH
jgi:hypothetical protein